MPVVIMKQNFTMKHVVKSQRVIETEVRKEGPRGLSLSLTEHTAWTTRSSDNAATSNVFASENDIIFVVLRV